MGMICLVLGIASVAGAFWPSISLGAYIIGVAGIVLSIKTRKEAAAANEPTTYATVGFILSIVGSSIAVIGAICVSCQSWSNNIVRSLGSYGSFF